MRTETILTRNAAFQKLQVLKTNRSKRHRYGEFLVEGVRNINGAVENGWEIRSFLYNREAELSRWAGDLLAAIQTERNFALAPALMEELSGKAETSELLAVAAMRDRDLQSLRFQGQPLLVLFDRPSNKGNLGTMLRTCDALGADALLLTGHGVDLYDIDVIVSSMGSFFRVPAYHVPAHDDLRRLLERVRGEHPGFRAAGTSAHAPLTLDEADFSGGLLLMLGNEKDGLSHGLAQLCDQMVTIPMSGDSSASSLNVACAASILLHEAGRQRRMGRP